MNLINDVAVTWWQWMSSMFWQVSLLILIISLIDYAFKDRLWPQVRSALWIVVLIKLVLPPTFSLPTGIVGHVQPRVQETIFTKILKMPAQAPITQKQAPTGETETPQNLPKTALQNDTFENSKPVTLTLNIAWQVYALGVWLMGILIFASLLFIKMARLRKWHDEQKDKELPAWFHELLVETAQHFNLVRMPAVVFSPKAVTPAVYGISNPVMMLPAGYFDDLSEEEAKHVLLHELAHLKRGDLILHAISLGLQIVYWFNPLLVWANRQMKHVREICCDLTVASVLREKTKEYRQTLLNTARDLLTERVEPGLGLLGVFEDPFRLVSRLRWLEKKTWETRNLMFAAAFAASLIVATSLLPMGNPSAKPQQIDESQWVEKSANDQSYDVDIKMTDVVYAVVLQKKENPDNFDVALAECRDLMEKQGIKIKGEAFFRLYTDPDDEAKSDLVWEVGFPVKKGTIPTYPLDLRIIAPMQIASTTVIGLKDTEKAWDKFINVIESQDYVPAFPYAVEIYKGKKNQPEWWETELQIQAFNPEEGYPGMTVEYKKTEPVYAIALPVHGSPYLKIAESKEKLEKYLKKNNIKKTGYLFGRYYSSSSEDLVHDFYWELCCPVEKGSEVEKPFRIIEIPSTKVASTVLKGKMEPENPWSSFIVEMVIDGQLPIGKATEIWSDDQRRNPTVELQIPITSLKPQDESWEEWGENIGENMMQWGMEFGEQMGQMGMDIAAEYKGQADTEDLKKRLADIGDEMRDAMRKNDYDTMLKFWDKDVVFNSHEQPEQYGHAALMRQWKMNDNFGVKFHQYNTNDIIIERCGDQIMAIGTYGIAYSLKDNPTKTYHDYGKYVTLWKEKPDGSLVITYSMTNTDLQSN